MNSHWPLLLAILMIGAAGFYGYYVQGENEEHGKVVSEIKTLPAKYVSTPPKIAPPAVLIKSPAPIVTPVIEQPNPINPAARQVNPVNPGAPVPVLGAVDKEAVFNTLRVALSQRFNIEPVQSNAGYTLAITGARLDVDHTVWSISLYNDNKAAPAVQSESFLAILNLVAANLDIDLNSPANTTADGKITRRPISKLGRLSMVTDPAMNNSIVIKPIIRRTAPMPNPGAVINPGGTLPVKPKPVQPARPAQVPVAPVKPPTTDQF